MLLACYQGRTQLNLSRFSHKIHPAHPLICSNTPSTPPKRTPYATQSAYVEMKSGRVCGPAWYMDNSLTVAIIERVVPRFLGPLTLWGSGFRA